MNNFQQELPKEKRIFKHKSEVQEMIIQINKLVQQGKFTSAYDLIEKCKKHLNSRAYYTDERFIKSYYNKCYRKRAKNKNKKRILRSPKILQ